MQRKNSQNLTGRSIFRSAFYLCVFLGVTCAVYGKGTSEEQEPKTFHYEPWFTGPLLVPSPTNALPQDPLIEPAITGFYTYGNYDEHWNLKTQTPIFSISSLFYAEVGITEKVGFQLIFPVLTSFRKNQSYTNMQDTTLFVGYQVSTDTQDSWVPDFRVMLQEIFPTGKFEKLDPLRMGLDETGQGAFLTGPAVCVHKTFPLSSHYFGLYASLGYLFPSQVKVKGLNAYIKDVTTKGKIRPGQIVVGYVSGEYSITQNWVFAFDSQYLYQQKSHFSGFVDKRTSKHIPEWVQISIAPEIEYNFSENSGLLGGLWFTVLGKNSSAFASAFIAYLYVF